MESRKTKKRIVQFQVDLSPSSDGVEKKYGQKQKNHIFRLRMFLERLGHSKYSKNQKAKKVATLGL